MTPSTPFESKVNTDKAPIELDDDTTAELDIDQEVTVIDRPYPFTYSTVELTLAGQLRVGTMESIYLTP
ncbi:hypothetical protein [Oleiharenicola lentus]|uniref:hypothetical protein n=1 Tax=Oleiharenicola lentus TaxID=2508720 RepID=UPI003F674576